MMSTILWKSRNLLNRYFLLQIKDAHFIIIEISETKKFNLLLNPQR